MEKGCGWIWRQWRQCTATMSASAPTLTQFSSKHTLILLILRGHMLVEWPWIFAFNWCYSLCKKWPIRTHTKEWIANSSVCSRNFHWDIQICGLLRLCWISNFEDYQFVKQFLSAARHDLFFGGSLKKFKSIFTIKEFSIICLFARWMLSGEW